MRKDDLKKAIVELLNKAEMHGYEIQRQLASKGFRVHLSYLYAVLSEMEQEGYLEGSQVKSTLGPKKKVFRLGKKGSEELDQELKEAVKTIHVKYAEYLTKLPPGKSIIRKLQRLLDVQVGRGDKILVVAPKTFYNWMITSLCKIVKGGTVYLIKPKSTRLDVGFENLLVLDTPSRNILLRDDFVNAVRVHGEPENFHEAIKEFHRILKKDGNLALVVPHFHPRKDDRPFTLAEFVEKVEHEISKKGQNQSDSETIKSLLSSHFRKVKYYRLAHLAVFVAKDKM